MTSAIGPAYIIPSIPQINGKIIMRGNKNRICRVNDRNNPSLGFPIDEKKFDDNGCILLTNVKNKYILKYLMAKVKYSSVPCPNIDTSCLGKSWNRIKAHTLMMLPTFLAVV